MLGHMQRPARLLLCSIATSSASAICMADRHAHCPQTCTMGKPGRVTCPRHTRHSRGQFPCSPRECSASALAPVRSERSAEAQASVQMLGRGTGRGPPAPRPQQERGLGRMGAMALLSGPGPPQNPQMGPNPGFGPAGKLPPCMPAAVATVPEEVLARVHASGCTTTSKPCMLAVQMP